MVLSMTGYPSGSRRWQFCYFSADRNGSASIRRRDTGFHDLQSAPFFLRAECLIFNTLPAVKARRPNPITVME